MIKSSSTNQKTNMDGATNTNLWDKTKDKIKSRFSKLTKVQVDSLKDNMGLLNSQLVKTYGYTKDFAKSESDAFVRSLNPIKAAGSVDREQQNKQNFRAEPDLEADDDQEAYHD